MNISILMKLNHQFLSFGHLSFSNFWLLNNVAIYIVLLLPWKHLLQEFLQMTT